jgi:dCMP deaminase
MERPTIDQVMIECASQFAARSTCLRVQAGAVIAVQNHIVSTGYNGTAHGRPHCCEHFAEVYQEQLGTNPFMKSEHPTFEDYIASSMFKSEHHDWSVINELHAEQNSIIYAARRGIAIGGATIYTTHSPCLSCAKAIIFSGIRKVFYRILYDREEGKMSLELLRQNEIEVLQI